MPAGPGESHLTTLFADVHYYFNDPSIKPQHHRFDRGSYVYLFHNVAEKRTKVEIANHAGTPDQDAFSGYLDIAKVSYTHKQPNLVTISVDGAALQGHDQWHLPSYNEKNEQKYLYRIHAMDMYLWTEKDGTYLLQQLQAILPAHQLDVRDAPLAPSPAEDPPAEHKDSMSPVVQQLERTAITPQFTPTRQESGASRQSLPGSPPNTSPAPMAYNPAAPAAPEPIAYREKTPPPPDADSGTGLANAAKYDSVPQNAYSNVPNTFGGPGPQQPYFSGPPQQAALRQPANLSFPGPPQGTPPASMHRGSTSSIGSTPQQTAPSFAAPPGQYSHSGRQPSFGSGAPVQQYASYPQQQPQQLQTRTPSFGPNAIASPGLPGPPQPQFQDPPTPSAPPAYTPAPSQFQQALPQHQDMTHGYSSYSYDTAASQTPQQSYNQSNPGGYTGDMHTQLYRPTTEEAAHGHGHGSHGKKSSKHEKQQQQQDPRQRIEDRVQGVEAKVGRFMRKLDRMI